MTMEEVLEKGVNIADITFVALQKTVGDGRFDNGMIAAVTLKIEVQKESTKVLIEDFAVKVAEMLTFILDEDNRPKDK